MMGNHCPDKYLLLLRPYHSYSPSARGGRAWGAALGVCVADGIQQRNELFQLPLAQRAHGRFVGSINLWIDSVEEPPPFWRCEADDLTTIRFAALAPNESGGLQLVEQTSDRRTLFDHALTNRERGNPGGTGTPNESQRVVLRETQPPRLDRSGDGATDDRRRAKQGDGCLLRWRLERPRLLDLLLNPRHDPLL
jgi:hypothetical protein